MLINRINKQICNCKICRENIIVQPIPGAGSIEAQILIVGQNTCYPRCIESRIPFTGGSGLILDEALIAAGLSRDTVYITNTVKCATFLNESPTLGMKINCRKFLLWELRLIKPKLVITLGRFAAEDFPIGNYTIVNLYHPAWYMRRGDKVGFIKEFRKAVKNGY